MLGARECATVLPVKTLVLLRHAKAESESDLGDHMRALAAKGREQARALGSLIHAETGDIDTVLVSSALRTKETYRLLAADDAQWPAGSSLDDLYEAGPREVLNVLAGVGEESGSVLVVGHAAGPPAGAPAPAVPHGSRGLAGDPRACQAWTMSTIETSGMMITLVR